MGTTRSITMKRRWNALQLFFAIVWRKHEGGRVGFIAALDIARSVA